MSALRDWAVVVAGEEILSWRSGIGIEKRMMRKRGVDEEEKRGEARLTEERVSRLGGIIAIESRGLGKNVVRNNSKESCC